MKHYKYIAELFQDLHHVTPRLTAEESKSLYEALGKHVFDGIPTADDELQSEATRMVYTFLTRVYDCKVKRQDEYSKHYGKN
ncbi:MAG: hypothetical protein MJZ41_13570 [Bacteroidaceae bacterium]|nr:hypothetical protein [Bacteroidaceae bacterium]